MESIKSPARNGHARSVRACNQSKVRLPYLEGRFDPKKTCAAWVETPDCAGFGAQIVGDLIVKADDFVDCLA